MRPLRIGIDARLSGGMESGGIGQVVVGLASGLSKLTHGGEEYLYLTRRGADDWLRPFVSGPCRILEGPEDPCAAAIQWIQIHIAGDAAVLLYREVVYRALCCQARRVAVASEWTRRDVLQQYGVDGEKARVIPLAPPTEAQDPPGAEKAREVGLEGQVRLLGVGGQKELACLYRLCRAVVIPTKFKAVSFPLWKAFLAGAPAACSRVPSLFEQAQDAPLQFAADDVGELAEAVGRLSTDPELRGELVERGRRRVAQFGWERRARVLGAHYRRLAGRVLERADEELLAEPAPL